MGNEIVVGIKLTADGKNLVGEVKLSQDAIDRLSKSTGNASSEAAQLNQQNKSLGATLGGVADMAKAAAAALGLYKLAEYAKDAALLNARYETLGISMTVVGRNAGYSAAQMEDAAQAMQKTGISMVESRQQAMRLVQAHIDLAQSTKLARIAQDAAVIGNMNSSEAFAAMIHGIQTGQTDVLRTIGLNISMEQSYKLMAQQLHKNVDALTQNEKTQGVLNAVILAGADIAGTYEAAMGTAGKQLNSMTRYTEDLKVKQGEVFNELLTVAVMAYTEHLKDANGELDEMAKNSQLKEWGESVTDVFVGLADNINNALGAAQILGKTLGLLAVYASVGALSKEGRSATAAYSGDVSAILASEDRFSKALETRRAALAEKRAADLVSVKAHNEQITAIMQFYTDQRVKGLMSEAAYLKTVTAIQQQEFGDRHQYKDTASTAKDTAAESAIKHAQDFIKHLKLQDEQLGLDEVQKKMVEAATLSLTVKSSALRMEIMKAAGAYGLHWQALKDEEAAQKRNEENIEALIKKYDEQALAESDAIKAINDYALATDEANKLRELELNLMGKTAGERAVAIEQYKIDLGLQKKVLDIKTKVLDVDRQQELIDQATAAANSAKRSVAAYEGARAAQEEWKKTADSIEKSLTDALMRGFEGGKDWARNFRDTLANLFKTLILRPIIQPIAQGASGMVMGAFGMPAQAGGMGGGSDLLSMGSNAYSLFGGIGGGLLGGAGDLIGGFGSAIGSSMVSGIGNGLAMAGQNIAVAGFFDGLAASTSLAIESASAGAWGTALGAAMPALGVIGAGIALLNAFGAFGGKETVSGQGVTMDVRGSSALGGSWTSYHRDGGWFGDDNNRKAGAPLADAQMAAVSATLTGVRTVVKGLADELGDPTILRRLGDFSASYNGASDGLDAWLKSVTESMLATALPGLEQFRRAGEDTQAVIARLAQTLQTIEDLTSTIDGQISVMSGDVSQYGYELAAANKVINDLYKTLGNTTDIQARVEIEGKLYQQVNARYQLEQKYLGELSGVLTQSLQSVRDARAAVGSSMSGIAGTPAPTAAELREAISGSVAGLALPSMHPVIDANLAMQQAAAAFKTESDRVAESNKEVRTTIASIPNIGGWAFNGHEQVSEFNTLMDLARNAGILAAGTMNYSNYRDSNAVISLKDGYRFTLDGAGIGQTANITHSQDWVDVNGIGWSRFQRTLGMEYYKPQGYEQVGAGVTAAVTDTAAAYQQAQDDFTAAMQAFAGDASRATEKLQGLREGTLKYYDTQKQLADLMRQSADALGQTITSLNRANMVPVSRYEASRAEFDRLYSGAAGLGGADLAARAAQLNSLAQPLMDAARESYASSPAYQAALAGITGSLADLQARLGAEAPRDYQAESLALLSGIDAALGYIETNLASADQQIVEAINASRDSTVAVLQDIRALLGGEQTTLSGLPGHADGLPYVPYDDYGARLHQGEGVIDARTMAGLRRYGIGGGAGGGSPEQLAEQRKTTEELRALVRLQSAANLALLEKLEAMEKRLGGIESKSRMAAAA